MCLLGLTAHHAAMRYVFAALAVGATLCGCAGAASSAGPPSDTHVCGTHLGQNWGADVVDLTQPAHQPVAYSNIFSGVFIRVSNNCDRGADVTWRPKAATHVLHVAKASDGLPVVIVLATPDKHRPFTVVATRQGKVVGRVQVR